MRLTNTISSKSTHSGGRNALKMGSENGPDGGVIDGTHKVTPSYNTSKAKYSSDYSRFGFFGRPLCGPVRPNMED